MELAAREQTLKFEDGGDSDEEVELVKSLALMHGGAAILESALGEGTTVTVRLPHAAVDAKGERIADANILPFRAVS